MTTRTPAKRASAGILSQLPDELRDAVENARGEQSAVEWVAQTLSERVERERQDAAPVADLDETPKRQSIRFRAVRYELRNLAEFAPVEQHDLNVDGQEFSDIWSSKEHLDRDQGERLTQLVEHLLDRVLDADDEIKAAMTPGQKAQTVLAFTYAPARQLAQLAQMLQQITQPGSESA